MKTLMIGLFLLSQGLAAQLRPDYYETNDTPSGRQNQQYEIRAWCNDRIIILTRAQQEASQFIYRGEFKLATMKLRQALVRAYTDIYSTNSPISQQMLSRAVRLMDTLVNTLNGERNGYKSIVYFVNKYIDYIKYAMTNVDIPYYQSGNCGYCRYNNSHEFEQALIDIAKMKLELVNDTLIYSRRVIPIGPTLLYLKASEVLSYYSKVDLENSLFANYYACQIRDLDYLHQRLKRYNQFEYPLRMKSMVYETFDQFENIISALSISQRCY